MSVDLKEIAEKCKEIINNPEEKLSDIKEIIKLIGNDENYNKVLFVAVLKVFKAVIPLYKVRTLKDKIVHKNDNLEVKDFDKLILSSYSSYVSKILGNESSVAYKCAVEILEHFDHFNYIDKIVGKILKGSLLSSTTSSLCCEAIQKKFLEDLKGEITFVIVNQMFEKDFNSKILSYLTDIIFLKDFLNEEVENFEIEKEKKKDKFFKYERSNDKKKRKIEKQRRIAENIVKEETEKEEKRNMFVFHRKIVDALQRLYFLILRDQKKDKFKFTFIGISKYKKFIRKEFLEGLYVLLNDAIALADLESKLYGVITTLEIYAQFKYDFKRLVDAFYSIISPFNYKLTREHLNLVENTLEELFIKYKQPIQRVYAVAHRLIILGTLRYSVEIKRMVKTLGIVHEIDFSDWFVNSNLDTKKDIDNFKNFPFYDYFLYKKML
ncbi:Nucleolar complex-associated protein 3 [Nosema granulosis]|uniref:Nucleolar complex-associated protein 3 n=1 Tax=Nosema granulosis TaxID=83296 RepID=A0A9P6GZZ0_9MICR|nr:Nucleolar complex-associated protein 3 [Nosema granulosis]